MSAVELSLTDIMAKLVVDDWGQCKGGKFGSLRAHVEAGKLSEATLHAELGQIVAGLKPGRESEDETILFWHRGLSLSDIALGHAMLEKARAAGHRPAASLRLTGPQARDLKGCRMSRMHECIRSIRRRRRRGRSCSAGLARECGVDLDVIDHAFPLPLAELWSRHDLACAFMCGFPYVLAAHRPRAGGGTRSRRSANPWAAGLRHASCGAGRLAISFTRGYIRRSPRLHGRRFPFRLQRAAASSAAILSSSAVQNFIARASGRCSRRDG